MCVLKMPCKIFCIILNSYIGMYNQKQTDNEFRSLVISCIDIIKFVFIESRWDHIQGESLWSWEFYLPSLLVLWEFHIEKFLEVISFVLVDFSTKAYTPTPLEHYSWEPRQNGCYLNNPVIFKQKCIDYIEKMTIYCHFFEIICTFIFLESIFQ